ncbi:DUF4426 domain-containing protein [Thalassotalea atypica]|uniref:DUF4426 domain-containing protein n=1 Tax=Thalassotalea atypica TaxID=2054316 RepID=UPI002573F257|nr:DUF4426 domain-containing protein [Thalassotalea atypica]
MRTHVMIKWLSVAIAVFALAFSTVSAAENMKKLGTMNVHYMAMGATFLTPEIARAYGIERSKYNALINISVLDNSKPNTPAKSVSISGTAENITGQFKRLEFEEVKEGSAIYYLAQLNYRDKETVKFDISINDGNESHQLKFSQIFYVE